MAFKLGYDVTSDGISDLSTLGTDEDLCTNLVWWPQPK